jgi:hypothetical protein
MKPIQEKKKMAFERFTPETQTSPLEPGIHHASITDVSDVSEKLSQYGYDWAIEVEFMLDGFKYPKTIVYKDKFARETDGKLNRKENKGIASLNNLLRLIRFDGGFDPVGVWRNVNGDEISISEGCREIIEHIRTHFSGMDFAVYAYRTKSRKDPDKTYIELAKRVFLKDQESEILSYVAYMLKNQQAADTKEETGTSL